MSVISKEPATKAPRQYCLSACSVTLKHSQPFDVCYSILQLFRTLHQFAVNSTSTLTWESDRELWIDQNNRMAALLAKFRIEYSDLVLITGHDSKPPSQSTTSWFQELIRHLLKKKDNLLGGITEDELRLFQDKTNRHLRLRELLVDHSSDSSLVAM